MSLALLTGALIGAGVWIIVWLLSRPIPGVTATLSRLDRAHGTRRAVTASEATSSSDRVAALRDSIGGRVEEFALARGWQLHGLRENLAVMDRSLANHLGSKVLIGLAAFIWVPTLVYLSGFFSGGVPLLIGLAAGTFGFFIPDLALKQEAEERRDDMRHVVGSFLDLVAMNLAGGRGLPEALMAASSFGDHWAMMRLRRALADARIMGLTPWEGLGQLGRNMGIDELRDLAATLALAGNEGARIRASLMARAESMRRKELNDAEGAAGESSQSMLMAQLLMVTAFLIFLAYPAVSNLA